MGASFACTTLDMMEEEGYRGTAVKGGEETVPSAWCRSARKMAFSYW
jgi:hypothetical protein